MEKTKCGPFRVGKEQEESDPYYLNQNGIIKNDSLPSLI